MIAWLSVMLLKNNLINTDSKNTNILYARIIIAKKYIIKHEARLIIKDGKKLLYVEDFKKITSLPQKNNREQ
jgi:hypothetical protein